MDDYVTRALARWPDVPDLYGWLSLDRRGRWRIQGELISRPQIIDTLNRRYAVDERGCWYFQNGPQRGFVSLESTPLIAQYTPGGGWVSHAGHRLVAPRRVVLDEQGALALDVDPGAALIEEEDLVVAMEALVCGDGRPLDEAALQQALAQPAGDTGLRWQQAGHACPVVRCDQADWPELLGFVRQPAATAEPAPTRH